MTSISFKTIRYWI